MNDKQRTWLADKLANTANIIIAGFIIGQLISDKPFNVLLFIVGVIIYLGLYAYGFFLLKGGDKENDN